jgi:hypothetical protein
MAMTIISQSLCLRSAFIITDENCNGSESPPQMRRKIPRLKLQISSQSRFDPLGFGWLEFVWNLDLGIWNFYCL